MSPALLALAALFLGAALQVRDGLYSPWAIALLALSCASAALLPLPVHRERVGERVGPPRDGRALSPALSLCTGRGRKSFAQGVLVAALLIQLVLLCTDFPGAHYVYRSTRDYWPFLVMIVVAIGLVLTIGTPRILFTSLLAIYLLAGAWVIRFTHAPKMDVFTFQRDACDALLHGANPYAITYPNVNGDEGAWVYGPGLVRDGRLLFGYPYMPVTLLWDVIGHVIVGDYRWMNLIAVAVAATCIASLGRTRVSVCAAAMLLFTPRGFYIIEQGWTEPLQVMLMAATVVAATRRWRVMPYLLGLLLVAKQYNVFLLILIPLLDRRPGTIMRALITGAIVSLPLAAWDAKSFWHSAVALQFAQPFRTDSLSFAALAANLGLGEPPAWLAFVVASIVAGLCLWKCHRSPASFALAVSVTYLAFFATNKQAFANYYFFVIGALCLCVASAENSCRPWETSDNTA